MIVEGTWLGPKLLDAPIIDSASWEEVLPGKEKPETVALALLLGGGPSTCVVLFDPKLLVEQQRDFCQSLEWQVERVIGLPRVAGEAGTL